MVSLGRFINNVRLFRLVCTTRIITGIISIFFIQSPCRDYKICVMVSKPHYLLDKYGIVWDERIKRKIDFDMFKSKVHMIIDNI